MSGKELIKAYNEMIEAQQKFMETRDDADLINARDAEDNFHELARNVPRLPYPQSEAEEAREKKRREEIENRCFAELAAQWSYKKAKAKSRGCACRNHVKVQKADCQNQA